MSRALPFFTSLFLLVLGLVFCWFLWRSYQKVAPSYQWPEVQTTIVENRLETYYPSEISPPAYRLIFAHEYEFNGQIYESSKIRPRTKNFMRLPDAKAESERYPIGSQFPAWVNPEKPGEAILKRDSKAMLYALPMPLFIIFLSSVLFYRSIFPKTDKKQSVLKKSRLLNFLA